jgi:serine/threonine protein kinase
MFDAIERLPRPCDPGASHARGERVGRHEVVAVLGATARTEVLLATTRGPHGFTRRVVLKRLRADSAESETSARHFAREAMAYARVSHPSVVHLYDVVEHEGRLVLVLEYVDGLSLGRLRRIMQPRGEALDDASVMYVMAHVFAALAAAHAASDPSTGELLPVVHRDVTPGNVLVGRDGAVKLTDFGIARVTGVESDTRAGLMKGTYGYMAPEQVLGDAITPRTDVYCACILLRELLLRRPTFARGHEGEGELELLDRMAHPRLAPIEALRSGVPPRICALLEVGLRARADERVCSAADLRDALMDSVSLRAARERLVATLADVDPQEAPGLHEQSVTTCPSDWMMDEKDTLPGAEPDEAVWFSRVMPISRTASAPPPPPPRSLPAVVTGLPAPEEHGTAGRARYAVLALPVVALGILAALVAHDGTPATGRAAPSSKATRQVAEGASSLDVVGDAGARAPDDPAEGALRTPASRWSHRLFVDGRLVGETGSDVTLPCGVHAVQVGGRGVPRRVDVPCGGIAQLELPSE